MSITLNDTLRIPERVAFRRVDDEMVLIDFDTSIYFGLDEVGARMWELLAEHGSLQIVAGCMEREYEIAPEQLRRDLLRLAEELREKGLVEVC